MYCPKCGKETPPENRYCIHCGAEAQKTKKNAVHTVNLKTVAGRFDLYCCLIILTIAVLLTLIVNMGILGFLITALVLFILWLYIRPYIMFFVTASSYTGICTDLNAAQIMYLLDAYPWCDTQTICIDNSEIPGTQCKAQLVLTGVSARIYLSIQDGVLYANGNSMAGEQRYHRLYQPQKEMQLLLQYIDVLQKQNIAEADRIRKENYATIELCNQFDSIDGTCRLFAHICGTIALILVIIYILYMVITSTG